MYAIIVAGGKQYKVAEGDTIYIEKMEVNDGDAVKFDKISYLEVLTKELQVMDAAAISLCKDNEMPLLVFDMTAPGNISRILKGEPVGTLVY